MGKLRGTKARLIYPQHVLAPDDLLNFVELKWFSKEWDAFRFNDEELGVLQIEIMIDPKRSPVVKGTDGLRKMRYSPSAWDEGKSGGLRVCYVHFERFYTILLVMVYRKGEMGDIPERAKRAINAAILRIENELSKRYGHLGEPSES